MGPREYEGMMWNDDTTVFSGDRTESDKVTKKHIMFWICVEFIHVSPVYGHSDGTVFDHTMKDGFIL